MIISSEVEKDLTDLRTAAAQRHGQVEPLAKLFLTLKPVNSVRILVGEIENYLPIFKKRYPEIQWPNQMLNSLYMTEYKLSGMPEFEPYDTKEFMNVASIHFYGALWCLRIASTRTNKHWANDLATGISGVISANLAEDWFANRPRDDQRIAQNFYSFQYDLTELGTWNDPDFITQEIVAWLDVADKVEKALDQL
jgi:hypothetical protein